MTIDTTVGLIAHLPLNDILKGSTGVEFQLVEVALHPSAINAAERLRELLDLNLGECFQVAAPTSSPQVVESPTLDELRATVKGWSDADRGTLVAYFERNGTDTANAEQVAEAIDAVTNLHDINEAPPPPPATIPADTPTLPSKPDEGDPAPDAAIDNVKTAYTNLDKPAKDWVNNIGQQARRAGLGFHMSTDTGGQRTMRRLRLMSALVALADGFNNGDAVRGCAANINPHVADSTAFNLGQVVGHMDADEAARFVEVVGALVDGQASFRFTGSTVRVEVGEAT